MKLQLVEEYEPVYRITSDETTAIFAEISDDDILIVSTILELFDQAQNILRNAYYGAGGE